MEAMFVKCTSLKSLPDISKWDITKVEKKKAMFRFCNKSLVIPSKFK